LLIEDDADDYLLTSDFLSEIEDDQYELDWASSFDAGLDAARKNEHDVILVDYRLGERTGLELVGAAIASGIKAPMIFLTGQRDRETDRAAMAAGAADYLIKGRIDGSALERSIRYALQRRRTEEVIERARTREIEIGSRIQTALLLSQPPGDLAGVSIGAVSLPSQRVDGDFWGFFRFNRGCFDVLVGDVMGKGVPAALLAAASKTHFQDCMRRLVLTCGEYGRLPDPEEIVSAVHYSVTSELAGLDSFVTLCYGRFDMRARRLHFVDAGHMRTIHHHASDATTVTLQGENLPLGVSETEVYAQSRTRFGSGDVFVFYSDGVTEARSPDGELFGVERLLDIVRANADEDAKSLAIRVCEAATSFAGAGGLSDDLTCLVVRIVGEAPPAPLETASMEVHSAPGEIDSMRRLVEWFCTEHSSPPLSPHERSTLVLAVSEAASNILNHAYWGARSKRVQVALEAYPGEVHVLLSDWGQSFDHAAVAPPSFDGSREGGFGVYIISQCVDEHRYYRDDLGRNCLHLVRKAGGRAAGEGEPS